MEENFQSTFPVKVHNQLWIHYQKTSIVLGRVSTKVVHQSCYVEHNCKSADF